MQKKARFDDRIRNLLALAQDGSGHSRTLLFSHISDLFLQGRPMASSVQIRMLTEILKELLNQVELSARKEIASALYDLTEPPEELIDIMCEDVVEVSGPLLEKANLPDEKLIHIIRYGTEAHRIHISRRFGLSPLVRHELEKAHALSESSKLKYSLNELDKRAEDFIPDMDEETTANILELLRAQKIHDSYPGPGTDSPPPAVSETCNSSGNFTPAVPASQTARQDENESIARPSRSDIPPENHRPENHRPENHRPETNIKTKTEDLFENEMAARLRPPELSGNDNGTVFPTDIAANDAALPGRSVRQPDSTLQMASASSDIDDDIWQQVQKARNETNRKREFVRTVADWFWEVDRSGHLSFISEEAFLIFGRTAPSLMGADFISLCVMPETDNDADQAGRSLESLFEHRAPFRNIPFYIATQDEEKSLWYMSAIAIFDIHSGRFTGFRGSACAQTGTEHLSAPSPDASRKSGHQEAELEKYITAQALKVAAPEIPVQQKAAQDNSNGTVAEELLQNLSHEFRTPLNAIIGFSEMIDMETWGPVNRQYHQNIKNILTAAAQLKEAVNDVLDSAKLDAGLMHITPESFSLKSVLKNSRENVESMAAENNVHMMDNDNNIDVILYNDKQSVELCLTKMYASIIRRAAGGEAINPSVLINSNARVRIELPVAGFKIDEKEAEKMFQRVKAEPDGQKDMARSEVKYEPKISSGFGLSIAQSLAHMIGGDISIHTAQGYVTHLVLTLSNYDPAS